MACLLDVGFKLRVLDFDGNLEPLLRFTKPECLKNLDVLSFEDKLRGGQKHIEVSGIPTAFADALKALDHWRYTDPETGEEVDLGRSKDWGPDTIIVLDSLTGMGRAAFRRTLAMMNRTMLNTRRNDWGVAMADQEAFIEKLTSTVNRHHVICTAHLKMVGPKDLEVGDSELTKELKEKLAQVVPTRLFPSALGRELPPHIGEHFPVQILIEPEYKGRTVRRVIRTMPRPDVDIGVPVPDLPPDLDITDGLITIFEKLTGGIEQCLITKTS
jgi:hypothetical protein